MLDAQCKLLTISLTRVWAQVYSQGNLHSDVISPKLRITDGKLFPAYGITDQTANVIYQQRRT